MGRVDPILVQIDKVEALCALLFNVQGYMHELLKEQSDE